MENVIPRKNKIKIAMPMKRKELSRRTINFAIISWVSNFNNKNLETKYFSTFLKILKEPIYSEFYRNRKDTHFLAKRMRLNMFPGFK